MPPPNLRTRPITIDEEGLRIPPQKLTDEVVRQFVAVARAPEERRGDLAAQAAAIDLGRRRVLELAARFGVQELRARGAALIDYTSRLLAARLAQIPAGVYAFADSLDDDGAGRDDVAIRVTLSVSGGRAVVDFSDS